MTEPYYRGDDVSLYLGDCRDIPEWRTADVLVTDPPYGIGWRRGLNKKPGRGKVGHAGIINDHDTGARDRVLELWAPRPAVVFGSFGAPAPACKQTLVWAKPENSGVFGSVTGYRRDIEAIYLIGDWPVVPVRFSSVLRSSNRTSGGSASPAGRTGHPHAKPLDLMEQLIAASPAGVIADPFAGSGSTLLAARLQGRPAIGVEIHEPYCELIARRLDQHLLL